MSKFTFPLTKGNEGYRTDVPRNTPEGMIYYYDSEFPNFDCTEAERASEWASIRAYGKIQENERAKQAKMGPLQRWLHNTMLKICNTNDFDKPRPL